MRKRLLDTIAPLDPPPADGPCCDHPDCLAEGRFRAPKSRHRLNEYYWFCLDHVRDYNRSWDYYAGMAPGEIEDHIREDTVWQRPSWPMGKWTSLGSEPGTGTDAIRRFLMWGPRKSMSTAPNQPGGGAFGESSRGSSKSSGPLLS